VNTSEIAYTVTSQTSRWC